MAEREDDRIVPQKRRAAWPWIRRGLAFALLLGVLVVAGISSLMKELQVCEELLATVGTQPLVESCRSLRMTDPLILVGLLAALALGLPDFSRIEIPGLLNLERRFEAQEQRQAELQREVHDLSIRISQQVSQRTMIHNMPIVSPGEDLGAIRKGLEEKAQEFLDEPE